MLVKPQDKRRIGSTWGKFLELGAGLPEQSTLNLTGLCSMFYIKENIKRHSMCSLNILFLLC